MIQHSLLSVNPDFPYFPAQQKPPHSIHTVRRLSSIKILLNYDKEHIIIAISFKLCACIANRFIVQRKIIFLYRIFQATRSFFNRRIFLNNCCCAITVCKARTRHNRFCDPLCLFLCESCCRGHSSIHRCCKPRLLSYRALLFISVLSF